VGARVALGHTPAQIAEPYLARAASSPDARGSLGARLRPGEAASREAAKLSLLFQKIQDAARAGRSAAEIAREIGAYALDARTMELDEEAFVARFEPALVPGGVGVWPTRSYVCTAFDAHDGAFKIWDAASGVDLARAVASSCAVPGVFPAITVGGR
jgi:NTE family protein